MKKRLAILFACVLPAAMVPADTAADLNAKWAARREITENSRRNLQENLDFPSGVTPGPGCGTAVQSLPAARLVEMFNPALVSEMSHAAQRQLAQLSLNTAKRSGGNPMAVAGLCFQTASALPFSDDNMRIACNCFLTAHVYAGATPRRVLAQLQTFVRTADSLGRRRHRIGVFGRVLLQFGL